MSKVWITREGTEIPIEEMSDNHLLNAIAYCERRARKMEKDAIAAGYYMLATLQGEMAIMDVEGKLAHLEEEGIDPSEAHPLYDDLQAEALKRGI